MIKKVIYWGGLLMLVIFSAITHSKELYGPYKADVLRVIDGDTIEVAIHAWPGLLKTVKIRLDGVNTPEKRGNGRRKVSACEKAAGIEASLFTKKWLEGVKSVTVYDVFLGKWAGRAIGKVKKGDEDLSEALINTGHAVPYFGGKRGAWC